MPPPTEIVVAPPAYDDMDEDDEEEDDERPLTRGEIVRRAAMPGPRGEGEAEGRDARAPQLDRYNILVRPCAVAAMATASSPCSVRGDGVRALSKHTYVHTHSPGTRQGTTESHGTGMVGMVRSRGPPSAPPPLQARTAWTETVVGKKRPANLPFLPGGRRRSPGRSRRGQQYSWPHAREEGGTPRGSTEMSAIRRPEGDLVVADLLERGQSVDDDAVGASVAARRRLLRTESRRRRAPRGVFDHHQQCRRT